jgi:hypothetical protein
MADMLYNAESQIPANATAAGWTLVQQTTPPSSMGVTLMPLMILAVVAVLVFMMMKR